MQIVIDDEKIIDLLETEWGYVGIREDVRRLLIENGTPLPKGHGRLIDVDDLDITTITTDDYRGNEVLDIVLKEDVDNAPTIIEADKGE